jgi:CxxC motif-containing protein (DUF1111 family)
MRRIPLLLLVLSVGCAQPRVKPGDPLPGLDKTRIDHFAVGKAVFTRRFTPEDGLGPLFNASSCGECHEEPAPGGRGDEVEIHVARLRPDGTCDTLENQGGPVIQQHVTPALKAALGIDAEPAPEGVTKAHRTADLLFGFGLLDAVPDREILAHADPEDRDHDGISGRANRGPDGSVGRFGRKAQVAHLRDFNSAALLIEIGVTSPDHLMESTVGGRPLPGGVDPAGDPEIDTAAVEDLDTFVRLLAPPAPLALDRAGRRGEGLFRRIGCAACHLPSLETGDDPVPALSHQKVAAYTDLLLHDMGPDLSDICMGLAGPSEFRTAPLMGLHLVTQFLHDGRAKSIDAAIRAHGGEASHARDVYRSLDETERQALLAFLGSL